MTTRITIRKPDDWHLHVRDGAMLKAVLPFTAKHFGRAILMPNLVPPVVTTKDAVAYRERVTAALPPGSSFKPLMTCYLTDDTDPDDVERGFKESVFTAVKLYPAHATTYSAAGVTDHRKIMPVLERMEKIGMPFLMHGEDVDPEVDIFDREAMFIERYLSKWTRQFPGLRFTLEHLSSKDGGDIGRGMLFSRHRFCAPSGREKARGEWHPGGVQRAGRDRDLCQSVRGGRRARQARSLCLAQRSQALSPAAQRRADHARKVAVDCAAGGQGRRPGRAGADLSRRGNDRMEGRVQLRCPLVIRSMHEAHSTALKRKES